MRAVYSLFALMAVSAPVFANPTFNVPEPATLSLLAAAGVGAALFGRRKK